jgi:EAL domain-containing protein (putative c-di-GMP-specific phosphodiesterase class I)
MEGVDGLEVLQRLAKMGCGATVIIASGQGGRVLDAAHRFAVANNLPFGGVLAKPYRRAQLTALLTHHPENPATETSTPVDTDRQWTEKEFEEEFRDALNCGAVSVVFQPKVSCSDGRVVGYEALARWMHPERGNIVPDEFVPKAERAGLAGLLSDVVLRQSLGWFGGHLERKGKRLSINISATEVAEPELDERLLRACHLAGVPTKQVVIEVTETSAMEDPVLSLQFLTRLRLQGFEVSLDDFGTGYSSMVQLARMPFSEIKVDRSFVKNAATSRESAIVVRSIIDLGHALEMKCTAEGVESEDVMSLLHKWHCDHAQGNFIGCPMVADDLHAWLETAPG